jgi:peptidoglycan/LPS O-acetylase OafA/YrhL
MASKRYYELDLLRFVAAFLVLLFHYTFRGAAGGDHVSDLSYPLFAPATQYGYLGVDLFFLISGFVILMSASSGSKRQFAISRFVRLYPAYWVCCTATWLVLLMAEHRRYVPTVPQYLVNMTMLNGFIGIPSVDSVYWSLAVEMKFYLLVFLVLLFRQIGRAKHLLGVWLAAWIVSTLWPIRVVSWFLIPEFAPYFIAGSMFFLISREGLDFYKLFVVVVSYFAVAIQAASQLPELSARYHTHYSPWVVCGAQALFFVVFFLIATGRTSKLASQKLVTLGALTYPLYLLHQNIGFSIFNWGLRYINVHVLLWSVVALMLVCAWLVNQVEKGWSKPLKDLLLRLTAPLVRAPSAG